MKRLTATQVAAAIRAAQPARLFDGEGLSLFINKAGRAYFILRFRHQGKDIERSLGRADSLSLAEARVKARELRAEIEAPKDEPTDTVPTFEAAAREHYEVIHPTFKNRKHAAQFISTLEAYAFPYFGHKAIDTVTEGDVTTALLAIWTDKPETASRVRQRIRAVHAAARGRGYVNHPLDFDAINAALPRVRKRVRNMPAMDNADVPAFYKKVQASRSNPTIRAALSLLMLSAVRPGNIYSAHWSDIDRAGRCWHIPAEKMKGDKAFTVPLTDAMVDALDIAATQGGESGLVFKGRDGASPLSADALRMAMRRLGTTATPHGFRTNLKTFAMENGVPDEVSERALAHVDPNKVRAAYARSDMLEQRRELAEDWAAFVTGRKRR